MVRYSYLAVDEDRKLITDWFAALNDEKTVNERPDGTWYYFRAMATKPLPDAASIDQKATPIVWIFSPQKRRGTLWTDGEVLFTPTPLKPQFPALHKISSSFGKWLRQFDLVFSQKATERSEWGYYLEAGIQNLDAELYALPKAMEALRAGRYFVHHQANAARLETLAMALRLRGYDVNAA